MSDTTMFGGCDLHIPHKQWSDDYHEKANYYEIERWAQRLKQCWPPSAPSGGISIVPKMVHRVYFDHGGDSNGTYFPAGIGNRTPLNFQKVNRHSQINDSQFVSLTDGLQFTVAGLVVFFGWMDMIQNTFVCHMDIQTRTVQHHAHEWREIEHVSGLNMSAAQIVPFGGGMWVDAGEVFVLSLEHVGDPPIVVEYKGVAIGMVQIEFNNG